MARMNWDRVQRENQVWSSWDYSAAMDRAAQPSLGAPDADTEPAPGRQPMAEAEQKFRSWADRWARARGADADQRAEFLRQLRQVPELRAYSRKDVASVLGRARTARDLLALARPVRAQRLRPASRRPPPTPQMS